MNPYRTIVRVIFLVLAGLLLPYGSFAWTDARPSGLVTELSVDRDGGATVTLRIRWRILAGRLHQFDLADLPLDFTLLEASAVTDTGVAVGLSTHTPAPGRLDVSLGDDNGGAHRGSVDVVIQYTTSLRAQGAIRRAGADAVLEVSTLPWERGLEATEIRLAIPTTERRAQWIPDDTPGVDATTTAEPTRDVVHALRRHLPAGTRWTARIAVDPRLFPWLSTGVVRPPRVIHRAGVSPRRAFSSSVVLVLGLLLLARAITRSVPPSALLSPRWHFVPGLLVGLSATLQALACTGIAPVYTLGVLCLLVAVALRVPPRAALVPFDPNAPPRTVTPRELSALVPTSHPSFLPTVQALLGVSVLAFPALSSSTLRSMALGILAVNLLVAVVSARVLRSTRPPSDLACLLGITRKLETALTRLATAKFVWTLQGDPAATGALCVNLVPRRGGSLAPGVLSVTVTVSTRACILGWSLCPLVRVRVRPRAPIALQLRQLSSRVGTLQRAPDGAVLVYTTEILGPDRRIFLSAWPGLLSHLLTPPDRPHRRVAHEVSTHAPSP